MSSNSDRVLYVRRWDGSGYSTMDATDVDEANVEVWIGPGDVGLGTKTNTASIVNVRIANAACYTAGQNAHLNPIIHYQVVFPSRVLLCIP